MSNLYELYVKLGIDRNEFDNGLKEAKKDTLSFGNSVKSVFSGTLLADFVKQAGQAAIQFGKESLQVASDLQEVQNVVDVTFGDGASTINAWAKAAKNSFGMGELNAKRFAGTMGAMLKSMGMTDEQTMDMSQSLVQLAGDMASFYNLDHQTAFDKIRAGISGETEPLKQLGINMSVANLEAYAMSQGIDKAYNSMTQAEQAALRYNYLLESTAGAQGDFARTSESYANQIKIFSENIADIKARLGQSLLDFITPALISFNEWYADIAGTSVEEQMEGIEATEQATLDSIDAKSLKANALIDKIEELGEKSELSELEMRTWESSLRELVALFPELAGNIDLTNMTINTTTDELRKNTAQAWKSARETAMINALQEKEQIRMNAIQAAAKAEIAREMQKAVAMDSAQAARELMGRYGLDTKAWAPEKMLDLDALYEHFGTLIHDPDFMNNPALVKFWDEAVLYNELNAEAVRKMGEADVAEREYSESYDRLSDVAEKWEESQRAADDARKAAEEAATAQAGYLEYLEKEAVTLSEVANAWQEVADYRTGVQESMAASLSKGTNELWGVIVTAEKMAEITKPLDDALANLTKNTAFYAQYNEGLQEAINRGVDQNLIAELAQKQTAENKALLDYIRSDASAEEIANLNAAWSNLGTAKGSLVDTMTEAALAVDEGYQAMVEAATEATEQINQYEIVKSNAELSANGIVDGLADVAPKIQAEVDKINAIMGTLGLGGNSLEIDIGGANSGIVGAVNGLLGAIPGAIQTGMNNATVVVSGQSVANAATPYISRLIANETHTRRYDR